MTDCPTADRILTAWETGLARGPLDRAIALLWALEDEPDAADLPLGQRDRRLLSLRRRLFGDTLEMLGTCPGCSAPVELNLSVEMLAGCLAAPVPETIEADGTVITLRPLTSRDLAAVDGVGPDALATALRDRLAEPAQGHSAATVDRLDRLIESRETAGEITLSLTCADCGTSWRDTLDVAAHVWIELAARAERLLGDVAELATAFGWCERDILALSPARRSAYLDLARRAV